MNREIKDYDKKELRFKYGLNEENEEMPPPTHPVPPEILRRYLRRINF